MLSTAPHPSTDTMRPMHEPLIGGIDPSSKSLAIVFPHPTTPTFMFKKTALGSPYTPTNTYLAKKHCKQFIRDLRKAIPNPRIMRVYLEAPIITGKGSVHSTMVQAFVSGAIQSEFIEAGFEVILTTNTAWKKEVIGSGAATKEQIKRHIKLLWPKLYYACHTDQDIIDAAAIARYGEIMNGKT